MKYYVVADVHGFFSVLDSALKDAGYYSDPKPHKLMVLGDLFDRGSEAAELQSYILNLMDKDEVILIRGNHEDLFVEMVTEDEGLPYSHHVSNGTYDTALHLTGYDPVMAQIRHYDFADEAMKTPYYRPCSITSRLSAMSLPMLGFPASLSITGVIAIIRPGETQARPTG